MNLPIIANGISVWAEGLDTKFINDTLFSLQRRFALRIIRGYRTVSTEAANVLANLIPIDLYLKGRAAEYYTKKGIENSIFNNYFNNTFVETNCIQRPISVKYLKHFGLRQPIPVITDSHTISTESIQVFSAGTGSQDGIGGAFIVTKNHTILKQKKIKISTNSTTFQSILYSINSALNHIKEKIIDFNIININLCNKSIVSALKDSNSTNELIFNIYETYYKLLEHNIKLYINFTHISAFEEYNLVESLSKESINSHNRIEYELIPNSRIKRIIYEKNIEMWNRRWNACTVGSGTKKYFQNINDRLLVKKFYKNDFYLTQVLTNHANFGQYLNRFKLKSTKVCDFCGHESDDSEHKMIFSPQFELKRIELKLLVESDGHQWPIPPKDLINKKYFNCFSNLCKNILE